MIALRLLHVLPSAPMTTPIILILSYLIDAKWGEPKRFHPLVGFGHLANRLEKNAKRDRLTGCLYWALLVLFLPLFYFLVYQPNLWFACLDVAVLYLAIGHKSLREHALQIFYPLMANDLEQARHYCSYMVSRQTEQLSPNEIARATTESVLENGHDAVIASLFWFVVGGAPMVIMHRLSNTLDAMWGYKNERFIDFGWCAAKSDDILGWPSAKITTFLYAIQGRTISALTNAFKQGRKYKSLNGGWVMAAGATVLGIKLGGSAQYHGKIINSPDLGAGPAVVPADIARSLKLVKRSSLIFIGMAFFSGVIHWL